MLFLKIVTIQKIGNKILEININFYLNTLFQKCTFNENFNFIQLIVFLILHHNHQKFLLNHINNIINFLWKLMLDKIGTTQIISAFIFVFVAWYYWTFRRYRVFYQSPYDPKMKNIGNPLPAFTNGWFIVTTSDQLKSGNTLNLQKWGENIVVYRGTNGKVYALQAYCLHMGSNLAVQGKVKNDSCIQCPFHGWSYDGETGYCVDNNKKPLRGISFQYNENVGELNSKLQWKKCEEENIQLRKYPIKQVNGYIYIWIHSKKQYQDKPLFDVFDLKWVKDQLSYRGKALNIIKSHIQDIPENGADIMHFYYVHRYFNKFIKFVYLIWKAGWKKGSDPLIKQQFQHKAKFIHNFKQNLYKKYIENSKDGEYIGVSTVDGYLNIPILGQFFAFNITVFQVGPGVVYIMVKFYIFTIVFVQYVQTQGKYKQQLYHEIYTPKWFPYWLSAFFLKVQSLQVLNDSYIWDAKQFKRKATYFKDNVADDSMRKWRQWFYKFYDGCSEKEKKNIDW